MTDNGELHVVFGTGAVGMSVMDELVQRSPRRVRMVNHSGRARVPHGVEVVGGDATDEAFAREASEGASVVYFALNPPYDKWPELFPGLQAGVLKGAASAGAKLIAMENLYMYGPTDGRPITEDLPYAPNTRKGRVRAMMSEELMEAHRSGRVRVAIGRASDFFGPRVLTSAAGEQVFGRAVEGKSAQVAGDPDQPHTYTYVPDIGKGLVVLGEREEALGRAWHLPSPETLTTRQFVEMIFEEVGKPARIQAAPKIVLRALGLFNPAIRETIEMLYEFEEPFVVDDSRFEREFGEQATPLREAIQHTVRWYREQRPPGT
ncbi:MAG: NAD-dependent epimerase/dehydratase family protein [Actinomycetota bacterium]|jgi:nucleoside-diphosphate-sugar epimerase|nr:NAD-dependent epimerase/dehydratase family protein [Actinomycetota bacterium]MDQ5819119.1 NAD-dependent epimerase/dehydratase family protein [Actinomycetota bacterium]